MISIFSTQWRSMYFAPIDTSHTSENLDLEVRPSLVLRIFSV